MRPVVAVTGLAFEAKIAAGAGVTVVCGGGGRIAAALDEAIARGCAGVISFGTAGGLAPDLAPGDWVVASAIVSGRGRFPADPRWSEKLSKLLPHATRAVIAGVDAPVADAAAKRALHQSTGAAAADMESHIAAAAAAAYGVPFAACRVIIDPAHRTLPPAALVGMRPDGSADVAAVFGSLARQPGQWLDLVRTALDARTARSALLRGRRMLGERLGLSDLG
jgi:hopanoid-associated phosphorylase